jgi:crooked neck
LKEERVMLLEEWLNKEVSFGDLGDVSLVQKKAPRKVKQKRPIPMEDGSTIAYALYSLVPFSISFSKSLHLPV